MSKLKDLAFGNALAVFFLRRWLPMVTGLGFADKDICGNAKGVTKIWAVVEPGRSRGET